MSDPNKQRLYRKDREAILLGRELPAIFEKAFGISAWEDQDAYCRFALSICESSGIHWDVPKKTPFSPEFVKRALKLMRRP